MHLEHTLRPQTEHKSIFRLTGEILRCLQHLHWSVEVGSLMSVAKVTLFTVAITKDSGNF